MKAGLVPVSFDGAGPVFDAQVAALRVLLAEEAEILEPVTLGGPLPEADAVVFPELTGDAYHRVADIAAIPLPILVLTSEFGTMAMWDWELISYLRAEGVETLAPYSLAAARTACRALAAKRELAGGRFLVFQDQPGEAGFQPAIFKRFYWWEEECAERIRDRFGLTIEKRSFAELGRRARTVTDDEALHEWGRIRETTPIPGVSERAALAAVRFYVAIRDELDESDGSMLGSGINCLNESACAIGTPCLAWSLLFAERDLIWGCEGDTVSMLTAFILERSLRVPILMTNLYPFLMGEAATAHERIPAFPEVDDPDDHLLAAHCGYFGLLPHAFTDDWRLRPKVLAIVDEDSTAIDAGLPLGDLTLSKLDPRFERLVVAEGELERYAGYAGSDCLNGAVIRVPDGHRLMQRLPSHHSLLTVGHDRAGFALLARIFGLELERVA
jgi:hypothetical protein